MKIEGEESILYLHVNLEDLCFQVVQSVEEDIEALFSIF